MMARVRLRKNDTRIDMAGTGYISLFNKKTRRIIGNFPMFTSTSFYRLMANILRVDFKESITKQGYQFTLPVRMFGRTIWLTPSSQYYDSSASSPSFLSRNLTEIAYFLYLNLDVIVDEYEIDVGMPNTPKDLFERGFFFYKHKGVVGLAKYFVYSPKYVYKDGKWFIIPKEKRFYVPSILYIQGGVIKSCSVAGDVPNTFHTFFSGDVCTVKTVTGDLRKDAGILDALVSDLQVIYANSMTTKVIYYKRKKIEYPGEEGLVLVDENEVEVVRR